MLAACCLFLVACAGTTPPRVNVLGVSQARSSSAAAQRKLLVVFVEVVNPSGHELEFSRLEYDLKSPSWFHTRGNVRLGRSVGAGSTAVIEIPVPINGAQAEVPRGAPYQLHGKLFARGNRMERSWNVQVKGALSKSASNLVRVQIADAE